MGGSDGLYEMLGLDSSASQADIKKAYYKLALQWHPDRNSAPDATAKFQALQRVYDVLGDAEKRKVYDRTGSLQDCEEMMTGSGFTDMFAAFRAAVKVTTEDIDAFAARYRGSDEERADLLRHYSKCKGNMGVAFQYVMLSRPELDSHRFLQTLQQAIADGEVQSTRAFERWASKVAATPPPKQDPLAPPAKAAGSGGKRGGGGGKDSSALVAAIRGKAGASHFDSMLASLEAKYAAPGGKQRSRGKKAGKAAHGGRGEPDDEELATARRRLQPQAGAADSDDAGAGADARAAAGKKARKSGSKRAAAVPQSQGEEGGSCKTSKRTRQGGGGEGAAAGTAAAAAAPKRRKQRA